MKTNGQESHAIVWGGGTIDFWLKRTNRRTLAITVQPDLSVWVTAPKQAALELVLARVRRRAGWIKRQQSEFRVFLPKMPPRRYVSGETHYYLGRQYRLKVVQAPKSDVKLKGQFIWVHCRDKADTGLVRKLLNRWYLGHAKERLARSFAESTARLGSRLATPPRMQIKFMPKRWGSWTQRSGVWLNPELIKTPALCIDYVVTHELCHAVHGHHGPKFYELLQRVMPDWEQRKARLERMPG